MEYPCPNYITVKYENTCLIICPPDQILLDMILNNIKKEFMMDKELLRQVFSACFSDYKVNFSDKNIGPIEEDSKCTRGANEIDEKIVDPLGNMEVLGIKEPREDPRIKEEEEEEAMENQIKNDVLFQISGILFSNFYCHLCDLQLHSNSDLEIHFQEKHEPISSVSESGASVFSCKQCGSKLQQYLTAIKHCDVRKKVSKDQPVKCPICSKPLHLKRNLKRHMDTHSQSAILPPLPYPYPCTKCKKLFKCGRATFDAHYEKCGLKTRIRRPKRVPTENDPCFTCSVCNFTSLYETGVKKHMTTYHIGVLPGYIHKCDDCGKTYSLLGSLKKHQQLHRKIGTYETPPFQIN